MTISALNQRREEETENKENKVKDLVEKLQRGEITPEEAKKRLDEIGLRTQESRKWKVSSMVIWATYVILCFPLNFTLSAQLQVISFPAMAIYLSLILLAIGTGFLLWVEYSHRKRGGLKGSDDTIIFYRDGLYGVMRHPGVFGFMLWFICLPIFLSVHVPFTFLSVAAIIIAIVYHYYMICVEEKVNVEKWGDKYRAYMEDVPRLIGIPKSKRTE